MSALMELDQALLQMLAALDPVTAIEQVELASANGRVVAGDVHATVMTPPFANSAMDGYAVIASDPGHARGAAFEVIEEIFAGVAPNNTVINGTCARIFTGAPMPAGADAVIAQEDARVTTAGVHFDQRPDAGRFVRAAGGDIAIGDLLVTAGARLHAASIALLAAAGVACVDVVRRPRVAVITNGDELRAPGALLAPGEINDTSSFALPALLAGLPVTITSVTHVSDNPGELARALDTAADNADAIITTGGVSVGDADHIRSVLNEGGDIAFWRLAIKPGKPFAYGHYRNTPFFGLPGNPVSSMVTFLLLVRPGLQQLAGTAPETLPRLRARLTAPVRKFPGRRDFQRARLLRHPDGRIDATAFARQDSNVLSVLAQADALLDLPSDAGDLDEGALVDVIELVGLFGPR